MHLRALSIAAGLTAFCLPALAADANAGRDLVMRSCTSCHTPETATTASDHAPPLSALAKTNRERPAWVRGWLMNPHPPMPNINLSRAQIDNIVAFLNTLPVN
jgi:cytochrome c